MLFSTHWQTRALFLFSLFNCVLSTEDNAPRHFEESDAIEVSYDIERSATLFLFPEALRSSIWTAQDACASTLPHYALDLAPETCLSGDYQLSNNLVISTLPRCPNGQTPAMVMYNGQNCIGDLAFYTKTPEGIPLNKCLFSESPKEWSLIFRCSVWPTLIEGAESHQIAIPPWHPEDPRQSGQDHREDGTIYKHRTADCQPSHDVQPFSVSVDECIQTSGYGLQIMKPGVCKSGKRAQLARFSDSNCDTPLRKDSIINIYDSDLETCLETSQPETHISKINSVAFWCRDLESPLEDPTHGQIYTDPSPPACKPGQFIYTTPQTIPVDQCVEVPGYEVQINRPAICPDGSRARFARFVDSACEIAMPDGFLRNIGDKDIGSCLYQDWIDTKSWKTRSMAFWCDGFGNFKKHPDSSSVVGYPNPTCPPFSFDDYEYSNLYVDVKGHQGCDGVNHRRLNPPVENSTCKQEPGTLSLEACTNYQTPRTRRPALLHSLPNVCIHRDIGYGFQDNIKILNPGRCADGSRPLFATYYSRGCKGPTRKAVQLTDENLATCLGTYSIRSVALLCDGRIMDPNPYYPNIDWYQPSRNAVRVWHKTPGVVNVMSFIALAVVSLVVITWVLVYLPLFRKIKELFRSRTGAIALSSDIESC